MKYKMEVVITDPKAKDGVNSDQMFLLDAEFVYDPKQYGNGYSMGIEGKGFSPQYYDIRYDKDFDRRHKIAYLAEWAERSWSGENGAYKLKSITITEA